MHKFISLLLVLGTGFFGCSDRSVERRAPHCIANQMSIQGAKEAWARDNNKVASEIPADGDLFGPERYIKEKPQCGSGGYYTLGPVSQRPRCSIPSHTP